jgi:hypothetical protein
MQRGLTEARQPHPDSFLSRKASRCGWLGQKPCRLVPSVGVVPMRYGVQNR